MLSRIAESLSWIGRYVKIGVGRGYADVAPVRGTYQESGVASLEVAVRSLTIDEARDLIASRGGPAPGRRSRKRSAASSSTRRSSFHRRGRCGPSSAVGGRRAWAGAHGTLPYGVAAIGTVATELLR